MASPAKAFEVRAEWTIVDDTCEGGAQKFQYQASNKNLADSFANLKTESNRLITGWMNGKKVSQRVSDAQPTPLSARQWRQPLTQTDRARACVCASNLLGPLAVF